VDQIGKWGTKLTRFDFFCNLNTLVSVPSREGGDAFSLFLDDGGFKKKILPRSEFELDNA
jgi:hypothetical protein